MRLGSGPGYRPKTAAGTVCDGPHPPRALSFASFTGQDVGIVWPTANDARRPVESIGEIAQLINVEEQRVSVIDLLK
jgi:hypothetical protein